MRTTILSTLVAVLCVVPAAQADVFDAVPVGGTVSVPGITVGAKSTASSLTLKRIEVRAAGAQTIVMRADGPEVLPPDSRRWFISADRGLSQRIALAVEADGKHFTGTLLTHDGAHAFEGSVQDGALRIAASKQLASEPAPWTCGNQEHGMMHDPVDPAPAGQLAAVPRAKGATLHEALIAVDTDQEFLATKFAGNEANATDYLDQLFALMNTFYERDLDIRLVRGTTILWASPDPWSAETPLAQVSEVGAYWRDNRAGVDRAFVTFLSGKGAPNTASGIAWVLTNGNYCTEKGQSGSQAAGHYSATQVFTFGGATAANDVLVVGHELGHNLGAYHSHCTGVTGNAPVGTNTIDQCFNGEADRGCYGGTPSCPSDNSLPNAGSLMSYCHFSGPAGAACANGSLREFHPVHQGVLDARIATNIANSCFTSAAGVPVDRVFYSGFE